MSISTVITTTAARTDTTATSVEDCARAVGTLFDSVYRRIEGWRAALEVFTADRDGLVSRAEIDALVSESVVDELAGDGLPIIGAGFVAAPGFLRDAPWHLAWWLGDTNTFGMGARSPRIRRLDTVEDPDSDRFRDYTLLEWWRVPFRTGRRHITGPYVDYLCTDEYTLTLTAPVFYAGRMVGVAGADLYVRDVERALLPPLRAAAGGTLVNESGRVLVSTNPHVATGSVLRAERGTAGPAPAAALPPVRPGSPGKAIPCGETGLSLVVTL